MCNESPLLKAQCESERRDNLVKYSGTCHNTHLKWSSWRWNGMAWVSLGRYQYRATDLGETPDPGSKLGSGPHPTVWVPSSGRVQFQPALTAKTKCRLIDRNSDESSIVSDWTDMLTFFQGCKLQSEFGQSVSRSERLGDVVLLPRWRRSAFHRALVHHGFCHPHSSSRWFCFRSMD